MTVLEAIARPLPHGVSYDQVARATLRASQPSDVEWMLVGLSDVQEALIRARYQHDARSKSKAWAWLFTECMGKGWYKNAAKGSVKRLADHALSYWLGWSFDGSGKKLLSPHICRTCEGVGEVIFDAKVHVCPSCRGSGRVAIRVYTLQRELEITAHHRTIWVDRYDEALGMMDREEGHAIGHMVKKIRG